MELFDFAFWQSFFSNLGATIIGVGLGIPVALLINRWVESRTEREKKAKILKLIHEELSNNDDSLNEWYSDPSINTIELLITHLRYELWSAFSDGGELQWIKDPETLAYISEAFACVRNVNELAISYYNLVFSSKTARRQNINKYLFSNLTYSVDFAIDMIEDALRVVYNEDIPVRDKSKEFNKQLEEKYDF